MDIENKTPDTFEQQMSSIAETVTSEREAFNKQYDSNKEGVNLELQQIKEELRKNYSALDKVNQQSTFTKPTSSQKNDYTEDINEEYKLVVKSLILKATEKGIPAAINEAQKHNDPYLIDVFHDSLASFMHKRIKDNNLL